MAEPNPETAPEKTKPSGAQKQKGAKPSGAQKENGTPRSFGDQAQAELRQARKSMRQIKDLSPQDQLGLRLRQAEVLALLEVADAFRESGST